MTTKMISHRTPRRPRLPKMPKNIERLYKEGKCRDCAVVVTRMDFAKILGKFTKVKIQYESNSTPKTKKSEITSPNSNARLKSNENGMVLLHRNAYNQHPVKQHPVKQHPVKELTGSKKANSSTFKQVNNVLKENNRLKKTPIVKDKNSNLNVSIFDEKALKPGSHLKQYGIIFVNPTKNKSKNDQRSKTNLDMLLPVIDKSILPNDNWCIEYHPIRDEPTDDKVYDRIAAELEDLMYNEKAKNKSEEGSEASENKAYDFPSIMDILNDSSSESKKADDQSSSLQFKSNLESSDVEAMLLGKTSNGKESVAPMEVDTNDVTNLIEDVAQLNSIQETVQNPESMSLPSMVQDEIENPQSPSILDEALQTGIEEHLPMLSIQEEASSVDSNQTPGCHLKNKSEESNKKTTRGSTSVSVPPKLNNSDKATIDKKVTQRTDVTHVIFKKKVDGACQKSVKCPKNLKYSIDIEGKQVELIGAPKFISSLEDLQVLLQIIEDTELKSLYILY